MEIISQTIHPSTAVSMRLIYNTLSFRRSAKQFPLEPAADRKQIVEYNGPFRPKITTLTSFYNDATINFFHPV